jgi:signal transduction histidine kinase/CheY-like chemotaxis protein
MKTLVSMTEKLLAERSVGSLLQRVTEAARELTGARSGVSMHGYTDGCFRIEAISGLDESLSSRHGKLLKIEKGGVYQDLLNKVSTIRLTDFELHHHPKWWGLPEAHPPLRGLLGARLFDRQGRVSGLIMLSDKGDGDFTSEDEALLSQLAAIASLALQQLDAQEKLQRAHDELELRVKQRTEELAESYAEIKKRAEQLRRLSSQLTLAEQRERRRMAYVIHDHLQQLLVAAKFNLEILSKHSREDRKKTIESILDLLDQSIETSRSLTAELSPQILYQRGLSAAMKWLARWMLENYALSVEMEIDPEAVPLQEDVAVLIFQSVRELLFNVVKHAGTNSARVWLSKEGTDKLRIVVTDHGAGFDPERMRKEAAQSTGFGIFTILERLEWMGGRLEVESRPGEGSTFTLIAPLGVGETSDAIRPFGSIDIAHPAENTIARAPHKNSKGQKIRVMLVDDHAVMRQGLSSLLEGHCDIEIVGQAADGIEAVRLAREINPDVILMDIGMPKMNGLEATRAIHPEQPHIRIIGLSMFDPSDQAEAMLAAGAEAYLTKSGNTETLLAAIRNSAGQKREGEGCEGY